MSVEPTITTSGQSKIFPGPSFPRPRTAARRLILDGQAVASARGCPLRVADVDHPGAVVRAHTEPQRISLKTPIRCSSCGADRHDLQVPATPDPPCALLPTAAATPARRPVALMSDRAAWAWVSWLAELYPDQVGAKSGCVRSRRYRRNAQMMSRSPSCAPRAERLDLLELPAEPVSRSSAWCRRVQDPVRLAYS